MSLVVHAGFVLFAGVDPQGHPAFMLLSWEEEPSTPRPTAARAAVRAKKRERRGTAVEDEVDQREYRRGGIDQQSPGITRSRYQQKA